MREVAGCDVDRTFEALLFDWDGTAVPDRAADAADVRARVEALCAAGVHVVVVSGTHVGNIDGQLRARPTGPGTLHLCLNRGSEVFVVDGDGVRLVERREPAPEEDRALDAAAAELVASLADRDLEAAVVSERLNRRKIDLIPEPAWRDPPKARIDELLVAVQARLRAAGIDGLGAVVALAEGVARGAGLARPCITSDVKHVEIGLTDKADSGRWAARWLAERGVTGRLVLVAGDELGPLGGVAGSDSLLLVPELARAAVVSVGVEPTGVPAGVIHLGGGPDRFLAVLDEQLTRRRERRVPALDEDPAWTVALPAAPEREMVASAVGTLPNGPAATRGAREERATGDRLPFAVNGRYDGGDPPGLAAGSAWYALDLRDAIPDRRRLCLRTGVLHRSWAGGRGQSLRFTSLADPDALGLRAEGPALDVLPDLPDGRRTTAGRSIAGDAATEPGITVAWHDEVASSGERRTVERVGAWRAPGVEAAVEERAAALADVGFDRLLAGHRAAWAQRWAGARVDVEGDPEVELGARFATFHLLACAPEAGDAAVGARGLTGTAYGGHVFWDTDVFMLPAVAALRPAAARAMVEYRIRRLPAALAAARAAGREGARFPWESAADGSDVTPPVVVGPRGPVEVHTGTREEHIVADVAWSACEYAAWTGDDLLLWGAGRPLLVETARWWASRARVDGDGRAHLDGVMGPDEYHPVVDDSAFTNVMARWNLRRAAALVEAHGGDRAEAGAWRRLADALVDGWDEERGVYEQFAGYWELEPLRVDAVADPPVALDLLLGADRVTGSQVLKQLDVLMLYHLVPGEVREAALAAHLDHYGPRTAHGSSLSPAITAGLQARAGRPDEALHLLRIAARLDLDDLTSTTAGGLHLATMGGVWQALAYGFLGLRPRRTHLALDPRLPSTWPSLRLTCTYRGHPVQVTAVPGEVEVRCAAPLPIAVAGGPVTVCPPPGGTYQTRSGAPAGATDGGRIR